MKDYLYGFLGGIIFMGGLWYFGTDFLVAIGISILASLFTLVMFYLFFLRHDSQRNDE